MPSRQAAAPLTLLALLLVAVAGAAVQPAVAAAGAAPRDSAPAGVASGTAGAPAATAAAVPPPNTTFDFQLQPDGDARVTVRATYYLASENDTRAFERIAGEYEAGETEPLGLPTFRAAATEAAAATGRSMSVREVSRDHEFRERENESDVGTLLLTFTWTNFGRVDGNRLYVGDAFNTTTGTWLSGLGPRQTLVIRPPPSYNGVYTAPIGVDNGVARWEGPTTFEGRLPYIVYTGERVTTTRPSPPGNGTTTGPPRSETPPGPGNPLSSALPFVLLLLGAGAAAVAAYVLRGDGPPSGGAAADDGGDEGASGAAGAGETPGASAESDGATPDDSGGSAGGPATPETTERPDAGGTTGPDTAEATGGGGGGESSAEGAAATTEDPIDEELLSDEERVERLLEENGGRMKQADIVKETGWSNAKVSQLLSSMEDEDRIDKLRIGRENLISFPDEDVAEFDSE